MKIINSTYFRRFMSKLFNECERSSEPLLITTRKDEPQPQQMIVISKAQYDMMIDKINGDK
jgi:PHD/YefM family antitoxin component YafN of YafNO toxin-antitoxin module